MSFEQIYLDHNSMVYNLALSYVQNSEDAQEITQDVFIRVFQSLKSFQNQSTIKTWMYRITINICLDYIKAKKRKKRFAFISSLFVDDSVKLRHEVIDFNHPGIKMEDKEALEILLNKINDLPDKQKTALILHKIEHKMQNEISEIMNLTPKAVESLIQRAKINLQKSLDSAKDDLK
ncbi:MAG: RNA polymerase sigma factor [Saprospiraceae bacterium]